MTAKCAAERPKPVLGRDTSRPNSTVQSLELQPFALPGV
jgi:hypothetical protein